MERVKNLEINYENLSEDKLRDLHLRKLALGEIQGPPTGKASIDKPWLKYYSEEAITTDMPSSSFYDCVKNNNITNLDKVALNFFGLKITFRKFFEEIEKVKKCLLSLGVSSGDVVVINSVTFPQSVYLLYALNSIGAIANFTDVRTDTNGMEHYINEGNSKFIFTLDSVYENIFPILDKTNVEKVILLSPFDIVPKPVSIISKMKEKACMSIEELKLSRKKAKEIRKLLKHSANVITWKDFIKKNSSDIRETAETYSANKPAVIVHTSGTTGKPKSVVLSNENFNSISHQYRVSDFDYSVGDTLLNIVPMFTAYGAVNSLHMPLSLGITDIVYPKVVGEDFTDIIMKFKPNHIVAIPMHWKILMDDPKMEGYDLSFLKTPACGGDKISEELEKRINDFLKSHNCHSNLVVGYGMTELSACATTNSNNSTLIGSVGIPLVKNNVKIINPDTDEEVNIGQSGEICINSPSMMLYYLNNIEETENVIRLHDDGKYWIHTGDLGHVSKDGNLIIDGRLKRLIIRRGFKVSASALEENILKSKGVIDCAVVKAFDEVDGEVPVAFVVLNDIDNYDFVLSEIKSIVGDNMPEYSYPKLYECIDSIPYTKNGKVDYSKLESMANEINNAKNRCLVK